MERKSILPKREGMFDYMFEDGYVTCLLDGYAAGSAGKGKAESTIVKYTSFNANDPNARKLCVVTTNSANASHWVYDNGKKMMFEVLPSSAYLHEKLTHVYIGHGASFSVDRLWKEVEQSGLPLEKLRIHPKTGIIQKIDEDMEKGKCDIDGNYYEEIGDGTIATGTTASGSGAVRCKKVIRNKTVVYAADVPELQPYLCDVEKEIMKELQAGHCCLLQIGQGFPLSYGLGYNKRNTTSRNVTAVAGLDDTMIPAYYLKHVILNGRTFPIKINNKKYRTIGDQLYKHYEAGSVIDKDYPTHLFKKVMTERGVDIVTIGGEFINAFEMKDFPDYPYEVVESFSGTGYSPIWNQESKQKEITWDDVEKNYGKEIPMDVKTTSLTKLVRRVFLFDQDLLRDGILYNMPPNNGKIFVSINFMNWVDGEMDEKDNIVTEKAWNWIEENMLPVMKDFNNAELVLLGTGRDSEDFVALEPNKD